MSPEHDAPRTPQAAIIVLMVALLVFFAAVSRLGKPDDPTGIHRCLEPLLRGQAARAPGARPDSPDQSLRDANGRIMAARGRISQVIGSVRLEHLENNGRSGAAVAAAPPGVPPERPLAPIPAPVPQPAFFPGETVPPPAPAHFGGGSGGGGRGRGFMPDTGMDAGANGSREIRELIAETGASSAAARFPARHLVKSGETLASISQQYYGNPRMFTRIQAANPWLERLKSGQTLVIPPAQ